MSNSKLVRPFDDICCRQYELIEQDNEIYTSFLEYARSRNMHDIQRKIDEMEETNARLRKNLESALKRKEQLEISVSKATSLLRQEKKETKRAQLIRDRMRQKVDNIANHVMESQDLPQRLKDLASAKITEFDKTSLITRTLPSSDSDTSAIACSLSDTDSDTWHLFPADFTKRSLSVSSVPFSLRSSSVNSIVESSNNSVIIFVEIWDSIKTRPHDYKSKIVVLGEACAVCDTRLQCGNHAQKCNSCKAIVHEKCRDQLAKPCIPTPIIKRNSTDLKDFCPHSKPMIPGIIFHSIEYVEAKGLNQVGIYGIHVYDPSIKRLSDKFNKGRGVPNLNNFTPQVVAAFIKHFFAMLNPSLIPATNFQKLVKYLKVDRKENPSYDELMDDLFQLPTPNRDTLAFLILHLQTVANSRNCKMNSYMLSKSFTPILVENFNSKTFSEEKIQRKVIQRFIEMPEDFWKRVLLTSCT